MVSIKFKHFLFFGLGGPIVNTLVWFVLRLLDQGTLLGGDAEEELSKWENGTKSFLCLFVEDRKVDVYVMQVYQLLLLNQLEKQHIVGTNASHPGLQHLFPHMGDPGRPLFVGRIQSILSRL